MLARFIPAFSALIFLAGFSQAADNVPQTTAHTSADYQRLPLSFELNSGQTDPAVKAYTRGSGYGLFLTATESVLALPRPNQQGAVLHMHHVGANPLAKVVGLDPLPGTVNYLIGNDATHWRHDVPTYARVRYEGIYPGIDLIYYGSQQQVEYDFVLAAGADSHAIQFSVEGARSVSISPAGDLVLDTSAGSVRHHKPLVYQQIAGIRHPVDGHYRLSGANQITFDIGRYDRTRELVIDPSLDFSTYYGGTSSEVAKAIAVDSLGNAYVTGYTASLNYPQVSPLQPAFGGGTSDAFVTVLNSKATAAVVSTFIGGSGSDSGTAIAVDPNFTANPFVYVTGVTTSTDFPTTLPLQAANAGGQDIWVAKVNALTHAIVYSTYFGGSGSDAANGIVADSSGNAIIAGSTSSANFPTKNPLQLALSGSLDAFVAKISSDGSTLLYSTYFGGSGVDAATAIALDSSSNIFIAGITSSSNLPTLAAAQNTLGGGGEDAFITKFKADGTGLVFSTYLGGTAQDQGKGIAVDLTGDAFITGVTNSIDFPTVNPLQKTNGGGSDAFLVKYSAAGVVVFSTYFGGSGNDVAYGVALDPSGNAFFAGSTTSKNLSLINPVQSANAGGTDGFVVKYSNNGLTVIYATYLGGSGSDIIYGITVGSQGNARVTGNTNSPNFPTTPGVVQPANAGASDIFVSKIKS